MHTNPLDCEAPCSGAKPPYEGKLQRRRNLDGPVYTSASADGGPRHDIEETKSPPRTGEDTCTGSRNDTEGLRRAGRADGEERRRPMRRSAAGRRSEAAYAKAAESAEPATSDAGSTRP